MRGTDRVVDDVAAPRAVGAGEAVVERSRSHQRGGRDRQDGRRPAPGQVPRTTLAGTDPGHLVRAHGAHRPTGPVRAAGPGHVRPGRVRAPALLGPTPPATTRTPGHRGRLRRTQRVQPRLAPRRTHLLLGGHVGEHRLLVRRTHRGHQGPRDHRPRGLLRPRPHRPAHRATPTPARGGLGPLHRVRDGSRPNAGPSTGPTSSSGPATKSAPTP